tara:strand:+ start:465 stop:2051 length:1587 start_codon:yes stop_codon:yes gene_type:complete
MAKRINEDIRFYLPADPYYYQVDNLPLEDLLANDVRLQNQVDEINSAERGNTVGRAGFTELQPFIDAALPGTVSVRPGNFIGRSQRTSGGSLVGAEGTNRVNDGIYEMNTPPTEFGIGDNPTGKYSVSNPTTSTSTAGRYVGRNSVFNFKGGNISIDSFNFDDFQFDANRTAPLGRLDLIGITTVNGAMDDPYLPGNPEANDAVIGDGYAKLAVVKGAGLTTITNGQREVVIGEKYITVGTPQENVNDFGRNIDGDVVPNPEIGTVPMPDDVVNVNFARTLASNGEIAQSLQEYAYSNKNASFFLPLAYVFVPQSHVEGNPIPEGYLNDIRPFFRTAELTLQERQAVAGSVEPSIQNPFVTQSHLISKLGFETDSITDLVNQLASRVETLEQNEGKVKSWNVLADTSNRNSLPIFLEPGTYQFQGTFSTGSDKTGGGEPLVIGVHQGGNYPRGRTLPNLMYRRININEDDDTVATQSLVFTVVTADLYQIASPGDPSFAAANQVPQRDAQGVSTGVVGTIIELMPISG